MPSKQRSSPRRTRPHEIFEKVEASALVTMRAEQAAAQSRTYPNDSSEQEHATKSAEKTGAMRPVRDGILVNTILKV